MGCTIDKGMAPSKNKELKAKLEHKLYLARENPEPVFDLSECDLKQVPQGIFTLCKVFRKEVLLLHNNRLSSLDNGGSINDLNLLTILDLHKNLLVTLPQSINVLTNLRELYLNNNRLKVYKRNM
ncbi:E3 ubiquitin-protein ligase LRSAM1-like [Ctenocephalides felis]|uniref:E3 ubiquitin-protein ligase LRSAM1-like n=1 Tax=Ctenocephalides felis TaxID=7515 RepID=UPI000E6E54C8|nr:E3 ubiquitin-protein ligase LRSAM1-like [Ctenocephalides felis]